jgi:ArsR family transcriptional regulator, lead/cadmium/zinc/bismuth-responsive transcriptional repressor
MSTRSDVQPRPAEPTDLCDVTHLHPARVAELRRLLIDEHAVVDLAETFRALGDPTRVRMLDALSHGELCVCDLASLVGLSESAVSHQLRLLRSLRLVRPRRDGRMVYYALDDRHIMTLFHQGLRHVQEVAGAGRDARRAWPAARTARSGGPIRGRGR